MLSRSIFNCSQTHERGQEQRESEGQNPQQRAARYISFASNQDFTQIPCSKENDITPAQEDLQARFYNEYHKVAEEYDKEFLKKYDDDLNTTLIFVSLN